jgi:hypothetical protein
MSLNYGLAKSASEHYPYGLIKDGAVIHTNTMEDTLSCILTHWLREYDTEFWDCSDISELLLPGGLL